MQKVLPSRTGPRHAEGGNTLPAMLAEKGYLRGRADIIAQTAESPTSQAVFQIEENVNGVVNLLRFL